MGAERGAQTRTRHSCEHAQQLGVLATCENGREPCVDGQQRANPPAPVQTSFVGGVDAGEQAKKRRLARTAGADQRDTLPRADREVQVKKTPVVDDVAAKPRHRRRQHTPVAIEEEANPYTVRRDARLHQPTTLANCPCSAR